MDGLRPEAWLKLIVPTVWHGCSAWGSRLPGRSPDVFRAPVGGCRGPLSACQEELRFLRQAS